MDHPQLLYSIYEPLLKENGTKKKQKQKKNRNLVSTNFLGWEGSTGSIEGGIEGEIVAEGGGGKRKNRTYH